MISLSIPQVARIILVLGASPKLVVQRDSPIIVVVG